MTGKRTLFIIGIVLFILFLFIAMVVFRKESPKNNDTNGLDPSNQNQAESNSPDSNVSLTKEEVSSHGTASDCWTIINGNVYDITEYISSHPGGKEIERACGIDASSLFNQRQTQEGDSVGSGTPHSNRATTQLDNYLIGSLEQ